MGTQSSVRFAKRAQTRGNRTASKMGREMIDPNGSRDCRDQAETSFACRELA
jgi:hypothetical protein